MNRINKSLDAQNFYPKQLGITQIEGKDYKGRQSAAFDYMNKIVKRLQLEIAIYKSSTPEAIQKKKILGKCDPLTRQWMKLSVSYGWMQNLLKHIRNM